MFLLGADTEFIAIKTIKGVDVLFPLEGIIHGTKADPDYIDKEKRGVLLDNVCVEYVCKPADNKYDFVKEQIFMRDYIEAMLSTFRLRIHKETAGYFQEKYLQSENNRTFGCSPAFNARTLKAFAAPNPNTNLRTASFHLHVSLDNELSFEEAAHLARLFDLHVGIPSVILQKDKIRRKMYGKAGEFRHTVYKGMEYRTLGNEYLFDEAKLELVYDQAEDAINAFLNGEDLPESEKIEYIINNYDEDGAKEIIKKYKLKTV